MKKLTLIIFSMAVLSLAAASNKTAKFLGDWGAWNDATIELNDVQALHGGTKVMITEGGKATVLIIEKGKTTEKQITMDPKSFEALMYRFVQNDFLTIKTNERPGVPDEAHPVIILKNAKGESFKVGKWANDENKRFDDIYNALLKIGSKE